MTIARGMSYVTLFPDMLNKINMFSEPARVHNAEQSTLQWNNRSSINVNMKGRKSVLSGSAKQRRDWNYS
jgi:osmotically-inducible protein OsmY